MDVAANPLVDATGIADLAALARTSGLWGLHACDVRASEQIDDIGQGARRYSSDH